MLCASGSEINIINGSIDAQRFKRRSDVESWEVQNLNDSDPKIDIKFKKSSLIESSNTVDWKSPFSRRRLRKSRSVIPNENDPFQNINSEHGGKIDTKVSFRRVIIRDSYYSVKEQTK